MQNSSLNFEFIEKLSTDLTVRDIMTNDVITLKPRNKVKNAKEIMRLRKISGIPIINDKGELKGVISIDDIIRGLEENRLNDELKVLMSTDLITISPDDSVADALRKFKKFKYGRLPVIDEENQLLGIITPGDITRKLLEEVERGSEDDEFFLQIKPLDKDKEEDNDTIQIEVEIEGGDFNNSGQASSKVKRVLKELGVSSANIRQAAIVTYEAEMNVVIHARRGRLIAEITPELIKIVVEDEGPGIEDIDLAMQPGYSTASEHIRELGFGAGMGLANIEQWADDLSIESEVGKGTKVEAKIYL